MTVKFQLESGEVVERSETSITIGSATNCQIVIANDRRVSPQHATLRKMGNRWLIESAGPSQVCVDDSAPAERHWLLTADQIIRLTPNGPRIVFQPSSVVVPPTVAVSPFREVVAPIAKSTPVVAPVEMPADRKAARRAVDDADEPEPVTADEESRPLAAKWGIGIGVTALVIALGCVAFIMTRSPAGIAEEAGNVTQEFAARRESVRKATVWIGAVAVEDGLTYPIGSGVLISPTQVATTAQCLVMIRDSYSKSGLFDRYVVFYPNDESQFEFKSYATHPKYEDKGNPSTSYYNVGLIKLERPAPHHVSLATREEQDELKQNPQVDLLGFTISSSEPKPFNPLKAPELGSYSGKLIEIDSPKDDPQGFSLLKLQLQAPDGTEGGPLVDDSGRLIAIALGGNEKTRSAILAYRLQEIRQP